MKNIRLLAYVALSLAMIILMIAILVISVISYQLDKKQGQNAVKHKVTAFEDRYLDLIQSDQKDIIQPVKDQLPEKENHERTFVFK
ncbi:MAG: hypothetical protein HUJ25_09310 [Crocinitomicaceae bacterium]|nr:hypothetical protein [Crocinitomicaceae bacterium]